MRATVVVLVAFVASACGRADDDAPGASATSTVDLEALRVPAEFPTIQAAVDAAVPGDLVLVAPGEYRESVEVHTERIVIRGEDRNATILDGDGELDDAIFVDADGVAVENLTIREYANNAVLWTGVEGYRASYVTSYRLGAYGLYALESTDGLFEHSYITGAADSAYYVGQCQPCNVLVTEVVGENSAGGYSGTNSSGGVYVVSSTFRANRVGAILSTFADLTQRDTSFVGNIVSGNGNPDAPTVFEEIYDAAFGVGIAIIGGTENLVLRNRVDANPALGIGLAPNAGDPGVPRPRANRIEANEISASGIADIGLVLPSAADGNCFTGNRFGASAPSDIETLAPCDGPVALTDDSPLDLAQFVRPHPRPARDAWMTMVAAPARPGMDRPTRSPAEPAIDVFAAPDLDGIPVP